MLALLPALLLFTFVSTVTPGPNNMMLMASGLNFGFRRTLPHMLGVNLGFAFMIALVGLGLAEIVVRSPALLMILKWAGAAYLVYLAVRIARSGPLGTGTARGAPMTFLQAAAFQWVNPKAWMIAVTACATYTVAAYPVASVLAIAGISCLVGLPCLTAWVAFGQGLRRLLSRPATMTAFNYTMAALLVLSLYPLFRE